MTLLTARGVRRSWRRQRRRGYLVPIVIAVAMATGAVWLVGYLLWPTFQDTASTPQRIPVSIGGTVFNVPERAFRIKVQKHSGPQERVDLAYSYPSLLPPEPRKHVTADEVEDGRQPIDRIFVSIATPGAALPPDVRVNTIYPRYLEPAAAPAQDGLTVRPFREASPYVGEDLYTGAAPPLVARCTREGDTPGMCLSERRVEGADLTFRFPRQWLVAWRDVAGAIDQLTAQLHRPRG